LICAIFPYTTLFRSVWFHQWGTELMLYPAPTPNCFETGLPSVMAIRRDVLFQVGGFNPDLVGDFFLGDGATGLNRKLWERGMVRSEDHTSELQSRFD